jgi:hypothetical protein
MSVEKRKAVRRRVSRQAVIVRDGKPLCGCIVSDISVSGAKLSVRNSSDLPDTFMLVLSSNGDVRRDCRIVWRADGAVGVAFPGRDAAAPGGTSWRGERRSSG